MTAEWWDGLSETKQRAIVAGLGPAVSSRACWCAVAQRAVAETMAGMAADFTSTHITEESDPQWMHDQAREHVRRMVEEQMRSHGLVPLDAVVVTREPWPDPSDLGRALIAYRARAHGVPPAPVV